MIDEVAATRELVLMFVEVELVIVELFAVKLLPVKFVFVKLVIEELVDVELVKVAFVALIFESEIFPAERFVIIALVRVAFEVVKKEVEAVRRFAESELVVEAFVVDAFNVAKLAVVPHSEVIVPETAEKIFEKRFVSTFRFVIDEVAATNEFVFKLVEVEFVIVPFATLIAGRERFVNERLVIVAEVSVAFPPAMLAVVMFAVEIFEVVELDVEAYIF